MSEAATAPSGLCVPADRLAAFISRAFVAAGPPPKDAETVAGLVAKADVRGNDTHGAIRLPIYLHRIRPGGINPTAEATALRRPRSTATTIWAPWRSTPRSCPSTRPRRPASAGLARDRLVKQLVR
jgi:hypothetical protein